VVKTPDLTREFTAPAGIVLAQRLRMKRRPTILASWLVVFSLACVTDAAAQGATLKLAWDASSGATGYIVYFGTQPGTYPGIYDVGNKTTAEIRGLMEGRRYYFVVRAYNASRDTSGPSNEVSGDAPFVTINRSTDVDGNGVPEASPVPSRIALGFSQYLPGQGGWLQTRAGSSHDYGSTAWLQVLRSSHYSVGGDLHPAAGDIDGDGLDELVVGLGRHGRGGIAILDDDEHSHALLAWIELGWEYYSSTFGAIYPAVGNLDADAAHEIVLGLGRGGQGWFKVLDDASAGFASIGWFETTWTGYKIANGEIHPAVGDLDGDGEGEIVLGFGAGSQGWVEIRNGLSKGFNSRLWLQAGWAGYNTLGGGGVTWPAVGNLDQDARAEMVFGFGPGSSSWLEVRDDLVANFRSLKWFQLGWAPYDAANGETHPAVGNIDEEPQAEIVIGLGTFPGSGGWFALRDGAASDYSLMGWKRTGWIGFDASGGATFPAVGRFR
jgi:hypothetical protein